MKRRQRQQHLAGKSPVVRIDRGYQRAVATGAYCGSVLHGPVVHDRDGGSEYFTCVYRPGGVCVVAVEQERRDEVAAPVFNTRQVAGLGIADDTRRFSVQGFDTRTHIFQLRGIYQWAHPDGGVGGIAHDETAELVFERLDAVFAACWRHQYAPDRGAFLARLLANVGGDIADHLVPCLAARGHVRTEYGRVEAVGLDVDAHGRLHVRVEAAQVFCRRARAREGKHILWAEMMQKVAGGTGDERQRALRQYIGVHKQFHHPVCQQCRAGGRLGDDRHAREQGHSGLFHESPGGKVVGIDVDGSALQRREDVLASVPRIARQPFGLPVHQKRPVAQRLAVGGIGQQRIVGAVHIEFGVVARVAAVADGQVQQFLPMRIQNVVDAPQARAAFGECQLPQSRSADVTRVVQSRLEVESARGSLGQWLLGGGVEQNGGFALTLVPRTACVAPELDH